MHCEDTGAMMSEWLDGQLDDERYAVLTTHLTSCSACEAELQALEAVDRLLASAPLVDAPPRLQARVMASLGRREQTRRLAIGGTVLALGALALALLALVPLVVALFSAGSVLPVLLSSGPHALAQLVALLELGGRILWMLLKSLADPLAVLATCVLALLLLLPEGLWRALQRRLDVRRW